MGETSAPSDRTVSPINDDPVAASMARNRSIMERMRAEQEMALQDNYQDVDMEQIARHRREVDEEEEMVRRAIAESEALHQRPRQPGPTDEDMVMEEESGDTSLNSLHPAINSRPNPDRNYDDEDAELQAALRASLGDVPEGYQLHNSPPPRMVPPSPRIISTPVEKIPASAVTAKKATDTGDSEIESETSSVTSPEEEQISMEEMRKRRLAKFGL